jgi:hypothetical protein
MAIKMRPNDPMNERRLFGDGGCAASNIRECKIGRPLALCGHGKRLD